MQTDFGMMENDTLSDCTAAAYYHALQIWSFNTTGKEATVPDSTVQSLYSATTGYDPSDPTTDQGAGEQDVLVYLYNSNAIDAFVEVDPRNMDDIKRTINDCGVAYIGLYLPNDFSYEKIPYIWDYTTPRSEDGHAVVLVGYNLDGFFFISWGKKYFMTNNFFADYCEEAYAIADSAWINSKGTTPGGLSKPELEKQMQGLRNAY